jgi:DivIVA domain-containing protein
MPDGHRTSINSASLTADEVARRTFPTVRKGFDPTDVRVFLDSLAEQLQTLYDREDDLRRRLGRAEQLAAHPEMDEATLTAALGQETTRVLRSAHDAAGDMKARADEAASHVIHLAHEEAARIRAEGERAAADRAAEAEVTAARIRSGASAEADSVLEVARQEAQAMKAGVQEDCRSMVREAQEVRARVLADLVRRRRALYGQVEHLRGGRQNLVEALREARRSFDHILETLQRDFDPGTAAPPTSEDGDGELGASRPDEAVATSGPRHDVAVAEQVRASARQPSRWSRPGEGADAGRGPDESTAASTVPGPPGPPPAIAAGTPAESPAAVAADQAHDESAGGEASGFGEQTSERRRSGFRIIRRPRHAPADAPSEPRDRQEAETRESPADDEGVRILGSVPDTVVPEKARSGGGRHARGLKEEARPTPAPRPRGRGGGRHRAPGSSAVDELFAKIKAGRAPSSRPPQGGEEAVPAADRRLEEMEATSSAPSAAPAPEAPDETPPPPPDATEATEATSTQPEAPPDGGAEAQPTPTARPTKEPEPTESEVSSADADEKADEKTEERESGPEASFLRRRDDAIGPITVALSRKLKRALQDDQNDLLDRLRSRGNRPLTEILPPVAEHQDHFRRAGVELLERAEQAGTSFLRAGRESDGRTNGSGGERGSVVLAEELATAITDPLRRRLERSLDGSDDPDEAGMVDNVSAAYREWKGPRIERVVGDHVVAAFSQGELEVAREGTALRWIVDDGGERCPDCDDNALAGALPRGERYPTGQARPPAHSGCRCLLAPPPA